MHVLSCAWLLADTIRLCARLAHMRTVGVQRPDLHERSVSDVFGGENQTF
jgi:hypothetical protein